MVRTEGEIIGHSRPKCSLDQPTLTFHALGLCPNSLNHKLDHLTGTSCMWFTTWLIIPNKSLPNKVIESPYHAIYFPYSVNLNSDSTRTAPVVNTSPFANVKSFLIVRYLIFHCFLVDEGIVCSQFFVRYFL